MRAREAANQVLFYKEWEPILLRQLKASSASLEPLVVESATILGCRGARVNDNLELDGVDGSRGLAPVFMTL